jgi:hypothetical protein
MITAGLILAAIPKSTSQTSPWRGFINQIEDFLFDGSGAEQFERVTVSGCNDLSDELLHLCDGLGTPRLQPCVECLS